MNKTLTIFTGLFIAYGTSSTQISKSFRKWETGEINHVSGISWNRIHDSNIDNYESDVSETSLFSDSVIINSSNKIQVQNLDIYLMIGQSNMAGRAEISQEYTDTLDHVFLFVGNADKEWEGASNPLNKYSTVRKELSMQKLNMGYSFAQKIAESFPGRSIGLVVNARGGTSIDLWMPGEVLYLKAVERAQAAMKFGSLKGILWHQGESDVEKYQQYMPKLLQIIQALRRDLGHPDLPFVAGQLSPDKSVREGFNKVILLLPERINNVAVVSSDSTNTLDSTHFDSKSQYLLGLRYAQEMKKLLKKSH